MSKDGFLLMNSISTINTLEYTSPSRLIVALLYLFSPYPKCLNHPPPPSVLILGPLEKKYGFLVFPKIVYPKPTSRYITISPKHNMCLGYWYS